MVWVGWWAAFTAQFPAAREDSAAVQLSFDSDKSSGWIDFHNLVRINGVWKITNKTATHSSR